MFHPPLRKAAARRGLSLAELIMSLAVMTMVALTVGSMSLAVHSTAQFSRDQATAVQHGRVVLDRLDRTLQAAHMSESFPGFLALSWSEGSDAFPDTLVIWKPNGNAADPTGLPRANELVIVRPDPTQPNRLIEITNPSEPATTTYAPSSTASWRTLVTTLTGRSNAVKIELTTLLHTAQGSSTRRGAVRFRYTSAPSNSELASYRAGSASWTSLAWPQDLVAATRGMRAVVCQTELQLAPDATDTSSNSVLPFIGSTMLWSQINR